MPFCPMIKSGLSTTGLVITALKVLRLGVLVAVASTSTWRTSWVVIFSPPFLEVAGEEGEPAVVQTSSFGIPST